MFRASATFGPPRMVGPPRMFGGRGAAAPAGVESEWCVSLDGSNDYVQIATTGLVSTTLSLSFWLKTSSTASYQAVVGSSATEKYEVYVRNGTEIYVALSGSNDAYWASSVALGTWQHFAIVAQSGVEWQLFKNGVSLGPPSAHAGTYQVDGTSVSSVEIGVARGASFGFFNGLIDDIRIYSRALSSTEITALATNTSPPTDVTAYLPLETGTGTTTPVLDSTGATIATATLVGGATWSSDVPPALAP